MARARNYVTTKRGRVKSTSRAQHGLFHARRLSHTHVTVKDGRKTYKRHKFGKHRSFNLPFIIPLSVLSFLVLFAGLVPVLEDPYHVDGKVTLLIWIIREILELIYGEVPAPGLLIPILG